jgi:hypothetical protein
VAGVFLADYDANGKFVRPENLFQLYACVGYAFDIYPGTGGQVGWTDVYTVDGSDYVLSADGTQMAPVQVFVSWHSEYDCSCKKH